MTLPHGWTSRRFDQLGELCSGSTPSSSRTEFWDGATVWVTPTDLSRLNTPYLHDSAKHITERGLRNCSARLLPPDAIVLSSRAPIGYVAIPTVPFCTNQGCKSIALHNSYHSAFVYYAVTAAVPRLKRLGEGTTFAEISKSSLAKAEVVLPIDTAEQAKIAEVLSTVDRAIEQTEAFIAKQQRIKTGLMQDLLTRGIDEHGDLRSEQTHEFKGSPLGRIPVEWDIASLGSVAESVTSGSRGWAKYYREEGPLFIRIGNLTREHINLRLDDLVFVQPPASAEGLRTAVQAGDLLISVTADLGIIGVIPKGFVEGYVNQHIALARLLPAEMSARFVGWFLSSREGRAQFDRLNESGAKAGLNLPTVRSLLFPRPDIDEQHRIGVAIDACVRIAEQHACSLQKLRALKRGLMHDLLTGNRRVTALLEQSRGVTT